MLGILRCTEKLTFPVRGVDKRHFRYVALNCGSGLGGETVLNGGK